MGVAAAYLALRCASLVLLVAVAAAVPSEPALTFADVQRVALASGSAAAAANARSATSGGLAQAEALGLPINRAVILDEPALAQTAVAPPPDDAQEKYAGSQQPAPLQQAPPEAASSRSAFVPYRPIAADSPFVRTKGLGFTLDNKTFYPGGTNWYDAILYGRFTEAFIMNELKVHWQKGVRVIRIFGFSCSGSWELTGGPGRLPIQSAPYQFNEVALRHYDFFMSACAQVGIRVIIALTNHLTNLGGIQWWVDKTLKKGVPKELFYSANQPRAAYKHWVKTLANRKNTKNGRIYRNDPTIFAFELCNECHTVDNYEYSKNMYPGTLLFNWLVEMSSFLKYDLRVLPMVTNGNEGFRMKGTYDPYASVSYPFLNWANTGLKGEDFNRNLYIKTLDFVTVHVYPKSFGMSNTSYAFVNDFMLGDRMRLARSAGKPLLFEEFGTQRDYLNPPSTGRNTVIASMLSAANAYGYPGALVWEVHATFGDDSYYDFNYQYALALFGVQRLMQPKHEKTKARGAASPFPYNCANACTEYSAGGRYTCKEQKAFGKCCESWMQTGNSYAPRGYCVATCSCGCNNSAFTACPTSLAQRSAAATGAKYAPKSVTKKPTKRAAVATIKKAG